MRISFYIILFIFFSQSLILPQSPYSFDAGREIAIFGGGVLLGSIDVKLIDDKNPIEYEVLANLSRENINSFDRGATYNWSLSTAEWSNVLLITAIASPLLLFTSSAVRNDAGTFSTMFLLNILTTYSVSIFPKGIVTRYRPYVYNKNVPDEIKQNVDATHSFLSAHTSIAFASAIFLSTTFGKYNPDSKLKPYIWSSSILFAVIVGYLRYAAGQHFPTDIIAGAVLGSVVGFIIPLIHGNENGKSPVVPTAIPYNNIVSFSFNF